MSNVLTPGRYRRAWELPRALTATVYPVWVTSSAPDVLQVNQGFARATGKLLTVLRFDREKVEQIKTKGQSSVYQHQLQHHQQRP